jgi:hypothetical protein
MLSEHKFLLRICESLSIVGALGSLLFALRCYLGGSTEAIDLAFISGFALLMVTFGPACALGGEYVRNVRRPGSFREQSAGLSSSEISAIVAWAPSAYKFAAILGVAIAVVAALAFGSVSWSSDRPPTSRDGIAAGLGLSGFFRLALPILGSAARMPGSYEDNYRNDA